MHTVAGEGTTRDTVHIVLVLGLLTILDDSDTCEDAFAEEVLALELVGEVWGGDLGTEPWGFPSVAEVCSYDTRVVGGIDSDIAPDLIPEASPIEGEDIDCLAIYLSDVDRQGTLLALGDELVVELGVGIECLALKPISSPSSVETTEPSALTISSFLMRLL